MHYRLPKVIEALRNTTFHLHKCAKLDRPDPFIFQEAHKRVGYARLDSRRYARLQHRLYTGPGYESMQSMHMVAR